jgi:predicted metal-binding protein
LPAVVFETGIISMMADELVKLAISCGAGKAAGILANQVVLSADFREICKSNACGNFGQCYMCPPDIGEIEELIQQARVFNTAVMYQAVYELEDSFDFEGMQSAGASFNRTSRLIHEKAREIINQPWLHLAAGGCRSCEICAKRENLPCRAPDQALASLEAYGVDVYQTAVQAGLKYANGANTVTYFGMLFF